MNNRSLLKQWGTALLLALTPAGAARLSNSARYIDDLDKYSPVDANGQRR